MSGTASNASHDRLVIAAIGDLILDVVVLPDAPLARDGDTPATIRLTAGGQAANVAAWATHLGGHGRLICARGSDRPAELAAADLTARGVELCGPVTAGLGGVVVSVRELDGARTMASDRGVSATLDPSRLDPSLVRSADVLHVSGYCLMRAPMAEAAIAAAADAPRVTVDLASAHAIATFGAEQFTARVRQLASQLVFATEAERAAVPDLDATWVIKRGARGASFPEGELPAVDVLVVDATGAGDALAAGYLLGGPELALAAAARCVATVGAMPGDDHTNDRPGSRGA